MTETIAAFLINSMTYSVLLKFLAFSFLWIVLFSQPPISRLGVWLNIFFFFVSATSLVVASFVDCIADITGPEDLAGTEEWALVILMNLLPFLTSVSGIMVAYYSHKAEKIIKERKNCNDQPQHTVSNDR